MASHGCIFGCKIVSSERTSFHRLPTIEPRRSEWLKQFPSSLSITPNSRICRKHFTANDFKENGRLLKHAIPSVNLVSRKRKSETICCFLCGTNDTAEEVLYQDFPSDFDEREKWCNHFNIPSTVDVSRAVLCHKHFYVIGQEQYLGLGACFSQQKINKQDAKPCHSKCEICEDYSSEVSYHNFPNEVKNKQVFDRWLEVSGVKDYRLGMKICSRHFFPSDFSNLSSENTKRFRLKKGAVPSLFIRNDDDDVGSVEGEVDINCSQQQMNDSIPNGDPECLQQQTVEISAVAPSDELINRLRAEIDKKDKIIKELRQMVNSLQCERSATSASTSLNVPTTNGPDASTNTSTPHGPRNQVSRTKLLYRFPGDICTPHVATPRRARKAVQFLQNCVSSQRKGQKKLKRQLANAQKKVRTLEEVIIRLHDSGVLVA